jgi:hypothetical protein
MSVLTSVILSTVIGDYNSGSFAIYAVAATLVLLPISIACDIFYSKQEPSKKTGAASIVMVIHAVIFALFGIGALIAAVFSIVSMFTSSSDSSASQIALFSSLIIFVLYIVTFLRTLNPAKLPWIRRSFIIFMAVAVGVIGLFGILGPAAHERATRTDRLIDDNLSSLSSDIDGYARQNNKLPGDLSALSLTGDTKKLVDDNLVNYKPDTLSPTPNVNSYDTSTYSSTTYQSSRRTYYYQLCVEYKKEKKDKYTSSYDSYSVDSNGYTSYISSSSHPAGEKCYKLKTSEY